jgi:fatty acid desaturase/nitrite reductase/ring-hydroxylating ferredoxin subunit
MTSATALRYSLTGPEAERAIESGLASASWFQPEVDPATMRALQTRSDGRAAFDVLLWIALVIGSGLLAWWSIWSWWSIPAFALYGALAGGAADARWHECGHGTAFRSGWANEVVYHVASFLLYRGPTVWRWSHYRHHTDTIVVGRDAEIVFKRPPNVARTAFAFTHLQGGPLMFWRLVQHAFGRVDDEARDFVPANEIRRVVWESRIMVAIVAGFVAWSLISWSIVPLLFVGLPQIYGAWLMVFFGLTQHAGLRENVLDHRLNTRTVYMNPVFRFLYLNMNYHVEHHIYPSVPYHALPKLHDEIKDQLATPLPTTWSAYKQIWSTLARQQRDPGFELEIDLPPAQAPPKPIDVGEQLWHHHHDGRIDLGTAASMVPGELRRVDVGGGTYVLVCLADGDIVLADGLCTHQQVHLCDGTIVDGAIECPKHNGRFDARTGEPVRKPVREPLPTYELEVVDGRIVSSLRARTTAEDLA